MTRVNSSVYDGLLGKTYSEIGTEARSMHKCQGMAQLLALPGPATRNYQLTECTIAGQLQNATRSSLTDGIDTSIAVARAVCRRRVRRRICIDGLNASVHRSSARRRRSSTPRATMRAWCRRCVAGLRTVRVLRSQLRKHARSRRRRGSKSSSGCGRRNASSSRR